jgi:Tfp pilus assembly protein PilE
MSSKRGAGLVSVMVAVAILAITLTAATSAFMSASKLTKHAGCFTKASNFAEGVMERVSAQSFGSIRSTEVHAPAALPEGKCSVVVAKRDSGLKEITVICSWVEGTTPHKVRFSTLAAEGGRR